MALTTSCSACARAAVTEALAVTSSALGLRVSSHIARRTRWTWDCSPRLTTAQYGEPVAVVKREANWRRPAFATHWPS